MRTKTVLLLAMLTIPCFTVSAFDSYPVSEYLYMVSNGKAETALYLYNDRGSDVVDIIFDIEAEEGLEVRLVPEKISRMMPEEYRTVEVKISHSGKILLRPEEKWIYINTYSGERLLQENEIQITVEPSPVFWKWLGGITAALMIAAQIIIFIRLSKKKETK